MPREAWLFVRGEESIRVLRVGSSPALVVSGPGPAEHSHHFPSEKSLDAFSKWYEAHLLNDGWTLHASMERRRLDEEPSAPPTERRRRGRAKPPEDSAS